MRISAREGVNLGSTSSLGIMGRLLGEPKLQAVLPCVLAGEVADGDRGVRPFESLVGGLRFRLCLIVSDCDRSRGELWRWGARSEVV